MVRCWWRRLPSDAASFAISDETGRAQSLHQHPAPTSPSETWILPSHVHTLDQAMPGEWRRCRRLVLSFTRGAWISGFFFGDNYSFGRWGAVSNMHCCSVGHL